MKRTKEIYAAYYASVRGKAHPCLINASRSMKRDGESKILDLCCGNGRNSVYLASRGFDVYGIDWSKTGIAQAKQDLRKQKLKAKLTVRSIFEPFPYKDGTFDAVVAIRAMYHGRTSQLKRVIKEVARVTRSGGHLYWHGVTRLNLKHIRELGDTLKPLEPDTYLVMDGPYATNVRHYFSKKGAIAFLVPYYKIESVKFEGSAFDIVAQKK